MKKKDAQRKERKRNKVGGTEDTGIEIQVCKIQKFKVKNKMTFFILVCILSFFCENLMNRLKNYNLIRIVSILYIRMGRDFFVFVSEALPS